MSGSNGDKDYIDDAKEYIKTLLNQIDTTYLDDDLEDDYTLDHSSSNSSPVTTQITSRPETPEETLLIDTLNDVILADEDAAIIEELYQLLHDTPDTEMPASLAEAIVNEQNTHNNAVYNLVEDVMEAQSAAIAQHAHSGIKRRPTGVFQIDTHVDKKHITCTFPTLEQAAVAYLYARNKSATEKISAHADKALREALKNPYYKKLHDNLGNYLKEYKNRGIDLAETMDSRIAKAKTRDNIYVPVRKRIKPT
jgi:hypothetical protein